MVASYGGWQAHRAVYSCERFANDSIRLWCPTEPLLCGTFTQSLRLVKSTASSVGQILVLWQDSCTPECDLNLVVIADFW
jgi:hypothetical protein